jgi:hypothetical protein
VMGRFFLEVVLLQVIRHMPEIKRWLKARP